MMSDVTAMIYARARTDTGLPLAVPTRRHASASNRRRTTRSFAHLAELPRRDPPAAPSRSSNAPRNRSGSKPGSAFSSPRLKQNATKPEHPFGICDVADHLPHAPFAFGRNGTPPASG